MKKQKKEQEFLCIKEVAEVLGLDQRTAKKMIENAEGLNYTRVGGKVLINKNKLLQYMDEHNIIRYK